jgi:hypothetical protein
VVACSGQDVNAFDPLLEHGLKPGQVGLSGADEATNVVVAMAAFKMEVLKVDERFRLFAIVANQETLGWLRILTVIWAKSHEQVHCGCDCF